MWHSRARLRKALDPLMIVDRRQGSPASPSLACWGKEAPACA